MAEQPGLKVPMPEHGATVARGNRMIHPIGTVTEDKKADARRTSPATTPNPTTSPSTPVIDGVRSIG